MTKVNKYGTSERYVLDRSQIGGPEARSKEYELHHVPLRIARNLITRFTAFNPLPSPLSTSSILTSLADLSSFTEVSRGSLLTDKAHGPSVPSA